ncbi:MAG: 2OG-Fe(II) oxygenase [Bdellovibrionales bacterium]|nr:2OG-Fe(II) oxygenase [Bdellovibrionales bacterium]
MKKELDRPYIMIKDGFYPKAKELRGFFDDQFRNPLEVHEGRFVWDYWNVPRQYCHLRTPAYNYFPEEIYNPFHESLVHWGRENLGCHDISPTWLSCYPAGSFQNVHKDEPHGPLAFVFSLTVKPSLFQGGRTVIGHQRNPRVLSKGRREAPQAVEGALKTFTSVPPKFNRLVVFDPSFPHGVSETSRTKDPRRSRLVVHGWFVQPRPFWDGPLEAEEIQESLESYLKGVSSAKELKSVVGFISLRIRISKAGKVESSKTLVSTLSVKSASLWLNNSLKEIKFAPRNKGSVLTLPLMFS